jgi:hypothetical protein
MKGREKPHTDKYKKIRNGWNYDTSCTLTSLPVSGLEDLKRLVFITPSVRSAQIKKQRECGAVNSGLERTALPNPFFATVWSLAYCRYRCVNGDNEQFMYY